MFKSLVVITLELIVVVLPCTVKLPVITASVLINKLPPVMLPVTLNEVNAPVLVIFGCAAVDNVPVSVVATTVVTPKLPTLALPVPVFNVPAMFAPVAVTVNTSAVPAELTVTLPLAATLTFDVPFCMAVASIPVS